MLIDPNRIAVVASVATTTIESLQAQFKFPERAATDGTAAKLPARSAIPRSSVNALTADANGNLTAANVTIPATADGATAISNGKMSVAVSLRGAKKATGLTTGGSALYSNADAHGGHLVQTVIADGVESFVSFGTSPSSDTIFDVSMNGIAGLRFVEGVVEFLDRDGAPRLRMSPPVVVDSAGVTASVTTTIEGCAYDESPAGPWGRKVTAPGASSSLPGGIFGICSGSGSAYGDANWFYPIGSNGVPTCSSACDQNEAGIHCWHDCVHANLDTDIANNIQYPFATFDSPGKPIFFVWHAWIDHLYGLRLDC